ncbi:PREDICTED: root phototropism protein 3-like [Ipomoea nil]|uniref:root phototropism protein 3-like n=1 Tax=Ipomoea nil TaxID=35883 RepID=UPI0009008BDE|nr:PREDICTED: root phototropism protein 3-like [Ipomoea nil]
MGIKGLIQQNPPASGSVCVEKRNHCFIFPPNNVNMVAYSVERRNNHWFVKTKASSDLTIQIENKSFHLHKIPMALKSGYINRLAFRSNGSSPDSDPSSIQMDSIPGGAKIFEQVVRFCYGLKINATPTNIAPLYCAAHFLEMNDDLEPGNLISKAEAFLSFIVLSSWKDTFRVVRSCESVSTWAKELQIVKQCSESIAWKVCSGTNASSFVSNEVFLNVVGKTSTDDKDLPSNWWFEDASTLRIDHFIELVSSIKKRRKIKPELVGSCIAHWTKKWLPRVRIGKQKSNNDNNDDDDDDLTIRLHRVTLECLIRILPNEDNSVSCNFLLQLFKIGVGMRIDSELLNQVKTRIAMMVERCRAKDLLALFDVEIVGQIVEATYACFHHISGKTHQVAKLVDEYLVLVARDESLTAKKFQMLIQVLPKEARNCDDNLYTAIDMYLKAHPKLTDEERREICRTLEYHKLSAEARAHVMRNHRLPESMMVRFILLEQVSMARSSASAGTLVSCSSGGRAVLRISKELRSQKEDVKVMKKDVEMLKIQVGKLQMCRMELQRQINKPALI